MTSIQYAVSGLSLGISDEQGEAKEEIRIDDNKAQIMAKVSTKPIDHHLLPSPFILIFSSILLALFLFSNPQGGDIASPNDITTGIPNPKLSLSSLSSSSYNNQSVTLSLQGNEKQYEKKATVVTLSSRNIEKSHVLLVSQNTTASLDPKTPSDKSIVPYESTNGPLLSSSRRKNHSNNTSLSNIIKPILLESLIWIAVPSVFAMIPIIAAIPQNMVWLAPLVVPIRRIRLGRLLPRIASRAAGINKVMTASLRRLIRFVPALLNRCKSLTKLFHQHTFKKLYKVMLDIYKKTGATKITTRTKKMIKILLHHSHHNHHDHNDSHHHQDEGHDHDDEEHEHHVN